MRFLIKVIEIAIILHFKFEFVQDVGFIMLCGSGTSSVFLAFFLAFLGFLGLSFFACDICTVSKRSIIEIGIGGVVVLVR